MKKIGSYRRIIHLQNTVIPEEVRQVAVQIPVHDGVRDDVAEMRSSDS